MTDNQTLFLPIIDVSVLLDNDSTNEYLQETASQIHHACRASGFFYVKNHGIPMTLQEKLIEFSREFFSQPSENKMQIEMSKGGGAWHGYFAVGNELTNGKPDRKEGIYFGTEIDDDKHPKFRAKPQFHGRNQFPSIRKEDNEFRDVILTYLKAIEHLGRSIMSGVAMSLKLDKNFFNKNYFLNEPTYLFGMFNYPAAFCQQQGYENLWGVSEHTDYGMLTIILQDTIGGLQVKLDHDKWIEAPPIPNTFVCNIGDMLDRMTGGYYRSTPHRVRNLSTTTDRLSFAYFLDPHWDAEVLPITMEGVTQINDDAELRWDKASVHKFSGTYGDYLLKKVSGIFSNLTEQ